MKKIAFCICCLCAVMFMSCTTGTENGHEWVDLGLPSGTKWATCNVGASAPEEYGDYFAWGETETQTTYNESTYKWFKKGKRRFLRLTKYNTDSYYGSVDNKTVLDLEDDAARANWGGQWRMPTDEEWDELLEKCRWKWRTVNGIRGYMVESKINDNSIFLPAAGSRSRDGLNDAGFDGSSWSSSLSTDDPYYAWGVYFGSGGESRRLYRYVGRSVRPVFK